MARPKRELRNLTLRLRADLCSDLEAVAEAKNIPLTALICTVLTGARADLLAWLAVQPRTVLALGEPNGAAKE